MDKFLYKLENGTLKGISMYERKLNFETGKYGDVLKEGLEEYKELIIKPRVEPTIYQNITEEYTETETTITKEYKLTNKTIEEIVEINTNFWNTNYFMIPISETEVYYAPHNTIMNNEVYNLLQDDLPMLMMGMSAQQIQYLDVYSMPDYTKEFTKEYIDSLKVRIEDVNKMATIIGYMASLTYANREVPVAL